MMLTDTIYSCADPEQHTTEIEQQQMTSSQQNSHRCISDGHQRTPLSAPLFTLASVNYPRMRGACGVLQQVGLFGDDDFSLGILLDGSCRVCGSRRCWHSHMAGSYAADLEGKDADEIPDEMWGWGHSPHNMKCPDFERMFSRLVNDEKNNLRLHCKSRRQIPWHPQRYTKGQRNSRVMRSLGRPWCEMTDDGRLLLRDELSEDQTKVPHSVRWHLANHGRGFLIHSGGVIPNVSVFSREFNGEFSEFDGGELAVFNWNNIILFTHEVLEEFLDLSCNNRMTHKGYICAKISTWLRSITYGPKTLDVNVSVRKLELIGQIRGKLVTAVLRGEDQQTTCLVADLAEIESSDTIPEKYISHGPVQDGWDSADEQVHAFSDQLLEFLNRPSLPNIWTDSIFEYMSLLDIDYTASFQCQCCTVRVRENSAELVSDDPHQLHVVYDNSCKLLDFILLRSPGIAQSILPVIDALHYSGHVNCSPYFNHKLNLATRNLNAALNEQVRFVALYP